MSIWDAAGGGMPADTYEIQQTETNKTRNTNARAEGRGSDPFD